MKTYPPSYPSPARGEGITLVEPAQKIYKVSEITKRIRSILESEFTGIWIEGEISNFKRHSSGHIYFTLKDETAQISAVFFARENQYLKFEPKDGLQVIAIGRISVYDARGQYQVVVQRLEPKGLGALQLAFNQLKERLEKEGLFAAEHKKQIPPYPKRIGIVTSPTGAAIQDMLKIFKAKKFGLQILLDPVRVQGDQAADEIAGAIDRFNQSASSERVDLVIVGRGGGSLEDLWAFNEETVARAIYRSQIPVISAVGHEVDWTIADMAADLRAHTPTAAAEYVVTQWDELDGRVREARERMMNGIKVLFQNKREAFANLRDSYAFRQPRVYLNQLSQRVDELLRQMQNYWNSFCEGKRQAMRSAAGRLEALSPLGILARGYSITFNEKGVLIKEAGQVAAGELIETKLGKGRIESKVVQICHSEA